MAKQIVKSHSSWIELFKGNHNTAVITEIMTGINILVLSGLDTRANIPDEYQLHSNKTAPDIFNDVNGIINTTQDDNCGGTGDIGIVYNDGRINYFSVTKYKGSISKCIINPSSKHYNIIKEDHKHILDKYFVDALKWLSTNHGEHPNDNWRRKRNPEATKVCKIISSIASDNWNSFTDTKKKDLLLRFMDIDEQESTNTKGIIFSTDTGITKIFNWEFSKKDFNNCLHTIYDGVFIYHCFDRENWKETWFLKTQVKFNNGIIELPSRAKSIPENKLEPKNGDLFGSWNVTCNLERVFDMTLVYELHIPKKVDSKGTMKSYKAQAKELKIRGYSGLKKPELIRLISKVYCPCNQTV